VIHQAPLCEGANGAKIGVALANRAGFYRIALIIVLACNVANAGLSTIPGYHALCIILATKVTLGLFAVGVLESRNVTDTVDFCGEIVK